MTNEQKEAIIEETWNTAYSDRRQWNLLHEDVRKEWRRVFDVFIKLYEAVKYKSDITL